MRDHVGTKRLLLVGLVLVAAVVLPAAGGQEG